MTGMMCGDMKQRVFIIVWTHEYISWWQRCSQLFWMYIDDVINNQWFRGFIITWWQNQNGMKLLLWNYMYKINGKEWGATKRVWFRFVIVLSFFLCFFFCWWTVFTGIYSANVHPFWQFRWRECGCWMMVIWKILYSKCWVSATPFHIEQSTKYYAYVLSTHKFCIFLFIHNKEKSTHFIGSIGNCLFRWIDL